MRNPRFLLASGLLVLAAQIGLLSAPARAQPDAGTAGAAGAAVPLPDTPALSIEPRTGLHRGSMISVKGGELAAFKDVDLTLEIGDATVGKHRVAAGTTMLTFSIPFAGQSSPALGSQAVRLVASGAQPGKTETRELGYVEIVPLDAAFEVQDIQPRVAYPKRDTYDLTVTGRGFGEMGQDHALFIGGREVEVCWNESRSGRCHSSSNDDPGAEGTTKAGGATADEPTGITGTRVSDRELRVQGLPARAYRGQYPVQLRLGNGPLSAPGRSCSRSGRALALRWLPPS